MTPDVDASGTAADHDKRQLSIPTNGESTRPDPERAARPQAVPRERRRPPAKEINAFGGVPLNATAWGIKRQSRSGQWEACSFGEDGLERHMWPLSELTDAVVRERWGAGTFKVQWWMARPDGGRKFLASGTPVTYTGPKQGAAVEVSHMQAPDPVQAHLEFMRTVSSEAETKIQQTLALVRELGGQRSHEGLSASDVLQMLREERAANAAALQAQLEAQAAATAAQIAALEARLQAVSEASDDDDGGDFAAAAAAALAGKKRSKGFLGFLGALAEHKDLIKEGAPVVLGALNTLAELARASQRASAAAIEQQKRPQAHPREQAPVVPPEPEETELEREQREAWERATAPLPKPNGAAAVT